MFILYRVLIIRTYDMAVSRRRGRDVMPTFSRIINVNMYWVKHNLNIININCYSNILLSYRIS